MNVIIGNPIVEPPSSGHLGCDWPAVPPEQIHRLGGEKNLDVSPPSAEIHQSRRREVWPKKQLLFASLGAMIIGFRSGVVSGPGPSKEEPEVIERLRHFLSDGAVNEARDLVKEAQRHWPQSPRPQKWARLLEPPKARVLKHRRSVTRDREYAWLRQHAHEYPGQWVALREDQLIASDADLAKVLEIVDRTGQAGEVLLHFQPQKA